MSARRDVVVIGGGHNGLVAAAYLAKSGLDVLVCERRPVVGGAVTQGLAWQWIFWLNAPVGVALIPLILTRLPASPVAGLTRSEASLDPVGLILATGAALGLVWPLIRADSIGWGSREIIATLAAGGCIAAVDAVLDARVDNAYALVRPPGHHAEADRGRGFCLIANVAVGGTWPGLATGENATMKIVYIRAFSNNSSIPAVALQTISSPDGGGHSLYGATSASSASSAASTWR